MDIDQQVGASIGTAVLSVILAHQVTTKLTEGASASGGGSGESEGGDIGGAIPQELLGKAAEAYGATFWWALGLVAVAFVVALTQLPKERPAPPADGEESDPAAAAHAMMA